MAESSRISGFTRRVFSSAAVTYALLTSPFGGAALMAQHVQEADPFPDSFTEAEWVTAYRLTLPRPEAQRRYAEQQKLWNAMRESFRRYAATGENEAPPGEGIEPAFGTGYSLTDLVMLSLLSDETREKVERVLGWSSRPPRSDDEFAGAYHQQRQELAPWVAQRLRELRAADADQ